MYGGVIASSQCFGTILREVPVIILGIAMGLPEVPLVSEVNYEFHTDPKGFVSSNPALRCFKPLGSIVTTMTTITPFTMSDYAAVTALWQVSDGVGLSGADEPDNIRFYLERNPGISSIAKEDDTVVGAVLGGHDGRRGYIHHLAVHPDYRRQGIGQQLVEHCFAALQAIGIQKCHLFIFQENQSGIAFWESIDWSRREDIAVMSKMVEGKWQIC